MPPAHAVSIEPCTRDALRAAKDAIWRLFDAGVFDEDSTTLELLAVAIGVRRGVRGGPALDNGSHDVQPH